MAPQESFPSLLPDGILLQVLQNAQEGVIVLDVSRRCVLWNTFMERATGITARAALGRGLSDVLPVLATSDASGAIERTLQGEEVPPVDVPLDPLPGSSTRWFAATCAPMRSSDDVIAGAIVTLTDITTHKQAEEALRHADERTKDALRATGTAVWELDLDTGELTWSANLDALIGRPLERFKIEEGLELVHASDVDRVRAACLATLTNRSPYNVEFRVVRPDGAIRWLLSIGRVAEALDGKPARVIGSTVDVTDRRTLEVQLRQSQKMEAVGRLAGGIAHDFNNLLTVIQGYGQLLADKATDPKQISEVREVIHAADRASGLTRQLLAFSRQQVMDPIALDLHDVVTGLMGLVRRLIGADIDLVVTLGDDVGKVWADKGQLEQVVMNLVVNARDAMPRGGRLTVKTDSVEIPAASVVESGGVSAGRYARLSVRDTGTGMNDDTKARVFEPFFTTKERGKGTGLGLSTVYGIVTQSGGHLQVHSELGTGSTFEMWLPVTDQAVQSEAEPKREPVRRSGGERVVLVIEDQEAVRALVRRILEREGFGVLEASEPARAEVLFDEHKADIALVVTDVVMPGEKGPDLYRRLASKKPELRVVYMSGHNEESVLGDDPRLAQERFLAKPFTAAGLIGIVQDVLRD